MTQLFKKLIESNSYSSSARFINLGGWAVSSIIMLYTTFMYQITFELFGAYLAYCAGTYGINKWIKKDAEK